jgi:ribosome-associated translation inhibitor RaiA
MQHRTAKPKKGQAMKLPLQIVFRDMPHSDALKGAIREKAAKLDLFYPHITACHVTLEMPGKHKHQGKDMGVRLAITVPGSEIVVNREHGEDIHAVLRDAFDAAKRQLDDYNRIQRGDVKRHVQLAPA